MGIGRLAVGDKLILSSECPAWSCARRCMRHASVLFMGSVPCAHLRPTFPFWYFPLFSFLSFVSPLTYFPFIFYLFYFFVFMMSLQPCRLDVSLTFSYPADHVPVTDRVQYVVPLPGCLPAGAGPSSEGVKRGSGTARGCKR